MSDARSNSYAVISRNRPLKVLVSAITLVAFFNEAISYGAKRRNLYYGRIKSRLNKLFSIIWRDISHRVIASITLIAFLATSIPADLAWAAGTPSELTSVGSDRAGSPGIIKELNTATFSLPENLGTVRYSWSSDKQPVNGEPRKTIIHIQDAHCNYAAQKRIAEIIEYLNREYGVSHINLEGGARDYDLSIFTGITDLPIREKVSDYFVK